MSFQWLTEGACVAQVGQPRSRAIADFVQNRVLDVLQAWFAVPGARRDFLDSSETYSVVLSLLTSGDGEESVAKRKLQVLQAFIVLCDSVEHHGDCEVPRGSQLRGFSWRIPVDAAGAHILDALNDVGRGLIESLSVEVRGVVGVGGLCAYESLRTGSTLQAAWHTKMRSVGTREILRRCFGEGKAELPRCGSMTFTPGALATSSVVPIPPLPSNQHSGRRCRGPCKIHSRRMQSAGNGSRIGSRLLARRLRPDRCWKLLRARYAHKAAPRTASDCQHSRAESYALCCALLCPATPLAPG